MAIFVTSRKAAVRRTRYVVCVKNDDHPASLEIRKVYKVLPDPEAQTHKLLRVVDESGEDYLYPAKWFVPITITQSVANALELAA